MSRQAIIDSFNRPDDAASLGTTDTGETWGTLWGTTFGIESRVAKYVSGGLDSRAWAYITAPSADGTTSVELTVLDASPAIMCRATDADNLFTAMCTTFGWVWLIKKTAGAWIEMANAPYMAQPGDILALRHIGPHIEVLVNGVTMISVTDSFNQGAVMHGLGVFNTSSTATRLDNFRWDPAPPGGIDRGMALVSDPEPPEEYSGILNLTAEIDPAKVNDVVAVSYFDGEVKIAGPLLDAPYAFEFNTVTRGTHVVELQARGYNAAGAQITSSRTRRFIASLHGGRAYITSPDDDAHPWSGTVALETAARRGDGLAASGGWVFGQMLQNVITARVDGFHADPNAWFRFTAAVDSGYRPIDSRVAPAEFTLNTTAFRNGRHRVTVLGETIGHFMDEMLGRRAESWAERWVRFDNGNAERELRLNQGTLWLVPNESVQLTGYIQHCDDTTSPTTVQNCVSSNGAAVSVTSTGLVTANTAGYSVLTVTAANGMATTARVLVLPARVFHHLGVGGPRTTYDPDKSKFVRAMFWLFTSAFNETRWNGIPGGIVAHVKYGGINCLNEFLYATNAWNGLPATAAGGANPVTYAQWQAWQAQVVDPVYALADQHDFYLIMAGDSICRTRREMSWVVSLWPYGLQSLKEAFIQARDSGRVLGIDMIDEANGLYGGDPFPHLQNPPTDPWNSTTPNPHGHAEVYDDVPANAFELLMNAINEVPGRPPVTWPVLGLSNAATAAAWMGDTRVADFATVFNPPYPGGNDTPAFGEGAAYSQDLLGKDQTMFGWHTALRTDLPKITLTTTMGPFYWKRSYGENSSEYIPGIDQLIGNMRGARQNQPCLASWYSVAIGAAGIKAYAYDSQASVESRATDATSPNTPVGQRYGIVGEMQTGSDPIFTQSNVWNSQANALSLIDRLERVCLHPNLTAPGFGRYIQAGVKGAPDHRLLILCNSGEEADVATVDLTAYAFTGGQIIQYRLLGPDRQVFQKTGSSDTVQLKPGEVVIYEFRAATLPRTPAIRFTLPVFSDAEVSTGNVLFRVEDTGGEPITSVDIVINTIVVGQMTPVSGGYEYAWDVDAYKLAVPARVNSWTIIGAVAHSANGADQEIRMQIMAKA